MAFRRRRFNFRRRFRRRYGNPYGAPVRRPRWNRRKRVAQNLTREVRWFKSAQSIQTVNNPSGQIRDVTRTNNLTVDDLIQFQKFGTIWEQYKVLKLMVKFYPVNNGGESLQSGAAIGTFAPRFFKGTVVTWCDPTPPADPGPSDILVTMGKPSARIASGNRFIKRWIDRPRSGFPEWGTLGGNGVINPASPDSWVGSIYLFGENFTGANPAVTAPPNMDQPTYYYKEVLMKIMFRSRQEV